MGTGSKSSHDSYAVGTTAAPEGPESPVAEAPGEPLSEQEMQAKADLLVAMDRLVEMIDNPVYPYPWDEPPFDAVGRYDLFVSQVEDAQAAIEKLKAEGTSEEQIEEHTKDLKAATIAFLNSLDEDDLREIAAAKGFEHPALVGLSGSSQHPLVHWLDPAYSSDIPSKQKIQAAALARYNQLLVGETVAGMTLTDLHQLEGTQPPVNDGSWTAAPEEVKAASQSFEAALTAYKNTKLGTPQEKSEALQALLFAEHKLATANCTELGEEMAKTKTDASLAVDSALFSHKLWPEDVQPLVEDAVASGQLTETEAKHLTPRELVIRMRSTTPESMGKNLADLAVKRQQHLTDLDSAYASHTAMAPEIGAPLDLPSAADPQGVQAVAAWAKNAGELSALQHAVSDWYSQSQQSLGDGPFDHPGANSWNYTNPDDLTNDFKAWAKEQKLGDLRKVAGELGMDNNAKATRAHVQDYIAGCFNPKYDQEAIQEKVALATAKKEAAKAAATASTEPKPGGLASDAAVQALASKLHGSGAGAGTSATKPNTATEPKTPKSAKPGSFNAKVQALMADLQHAKATSQDLPARIDDKEVAGWTFGPGTTASGLGGTYAKSVHQAPDGSKWLFKADHNHGGALGHTEASASHVLSLGGVPSVPVYSHKQSDGTAGSIQPMLQGAKPLTSSPSQWTQSQVDAIVRSHVGAWLIGDHDGHKDNFLQTPSGGLVQIDHGQAYKHFGLDKLSVDYAPSGGQGFTPVHQSLYQAALSGGLPEGVKINPAAAHPVIKKFESIPDTQLRSVLHATAHEGVKTGVAWVPQMRSRAAKALKIPQSQVTKEQIANAFLDHAVERKNSLRQDFADFFVKQLKLPSGASLKHGGS